ncbi:unnamed protein product [Effrenium voratum]|uniref:Uncharacterized protein n=1 Tax=Effrenium voratum TaxID=2562239 RepID=A0AA36JA39_9DINO|nr:unnamed protein product [Effrenium voratum]
MQTEAFELREYQQISVDQAIRENLIVNLPTGKGKTLIAVKVIDHFLRTKKHVVFVVPTKALVEQQAKYCESHCECKPQVDKLSGMEMDQWDEIKWEQCLKKHQVLVGTAEIFRRALDKGYLKAASLSLVVFDECHNATGKSPMARIMLDFMHRLPHAERPRILGLTASYHFGAAKNMSDFKKGRLNLERLLLASMFSPQVEDSGKHWSPVMWTPSDFAKDFKKAVLPTLLHAAETLGDAAEVKDFQKLCNRMHHVFEQLGREGLMDYLQKCVLSELERQWQELVQLQDVPAESRQCAQSLLEKLPQVRQILEQLEPWLKDLVKAAPVASPKLVALHDLLQKEPLKTGKGIIFVEQVAVTVPLALNLTRHVQRAVEGIYGGMTKKDQEGIVQRLRSGRTEILVSTAALEEGIDVCDCNWIVRYDKFGTCKSHIQGSGRARAAAAGRGGSAHIYYFENDPEEEASKARRMEEVARDQSLALSEEQRKKLEMKPKDAVGGVYPYQKGQEINFFNCQQIVSEWCQKVLGTRYNAESLYQRQVDGASPAPVSRVPTPDGLKEFFAGVIAKEQLAGVSALDRAKRRALFVVAWYLREKGLVDERNNAETVQLELAKSACQPTGQPPAKKLRIQGNFGRDGPEIKGGNYKGALMELLMRLHPHEPIQTLWEFRSTMEDDGWRVTLTLVREDRIFQSDPEATKKAAEHAVAKRALAELQMQNAPVRNLPIRLFFSEPRILLVSGPGQFTPGASVEAARRVSKSTPSLAWL